MLKIKQQRHKPYTTFSMADEAKIMKQLKADLEITRRVEMGFDQKTRKTRTTYRKFYLGPRPRWVLSQYSSTVVRSINPGSTARRDATGFKIALYDTIVDLKSVEFGKNGRYVVNRNCQKILKGYL